MQGNDIIKSVLTGFLDLDVPEVAYSYYIIIRHVVMSSIRNKEKTMIWPTLRLATYQSITRSKMHWCRFASCHQSVSAEREARTENAVFDLWPKNPCSLITESVLWSQYSLLFLGYWNWFRFIDDFSCLKMVDSNNRYVLCTRRFSEC